MRIPVAIVGHAATRGELQAMVEATCHVNRAMLASRRFAPLYESGIRYRPERRGPPVPGVERFQTLDSLHAVRFGDCDDLAPARAAELQHAGEWARPWVVPNPNGGWHVIVLRRDAHGRGFVEDPSARLGMFDYDTGEEAGMDEDVYGIGVHRCIGRRHVAAVGFIAGDAVIVGRGVADENDADGPHAARKAKTRAALRAFQGAASRGTSMAANIYGAPARMAGDAARAAAHAARAAADTQTMDDLGIDDSADDEDVSGFRFNPVAWRLYRVR